MTFHPPKCWMHILIKTRKMSVYKIDDLVRIYVFIANTYIFPMSYISKSEDTELPPHIFNIFHSVQRVCSMASFLNCWETGFFSIQECTDRSYMKLSYLPFLIIYHKLFSWDLLTCSCDKSIHSTSTSPKQHQAFDSEQDSTLTGVMNGQTTLPYLLQTWLTSFAAANLEKKAGRNLWKIFSELSATLPLSLSYLESQVDGHITKCAHDMKMCQKEQTRLDFTLESKVDMIQSNTILNKLTGEICNDSSIQWAFRKVLKALVRKVDNLLFRHYLSLLPPK